MTRIFFRRLRNNVALFSSHHSNNRLRAKFTRLQSVAIRSIQRNSTSTRTTILLFLALSGTCIVASEGSFDVFRRLRIYADSPDGPSSPKWSFGRPTTSSLRNDAEKKSYHEFMDLDDSGDHSNLPHIPGEGEAEQYIPKPSPRPPDPSILPIWLKSLPGFIRKLQSELSMASGSLAEELWREANDPECNPEIMWDARVRISEELCEEEQAFLGKRRQFTRVALAKYLNLNEDDVHEDDVPTIAICSSGGGLRALVAGTGSHLAAKEDGLFDCAMYTAGVSGSCWLQALYYSTITRQSHARLIQHLKNRLETHVAFPPAALSLLCSAPTNRYLLSGVLEKKRGDPQADFGLVDIWGILLAARLMIPRGDLAVNEHDLKISNQRRYVDAGQNPLPIYTSVRHEVPIESEIAKAKDDEHQTLNEEAHQKAVEKAKHESWFEWFECTPYEFFSEELCAGIPTYALGRPFANGKTQWRENGLALPELRLPLLMGIWGSAFCATLSHYWKEIKPLVKTLAGFSESGLEAWIESQDEEMGKFHPIDPAEISNFAYGLEARLPTSAAQTMTSKKTLELMDAGMSNNLPIYPLLRPGRNVDVIVAFDVSADIKKENWIGVTDGYAKRRGIKGWPIGAGWPREDESVAETTRTLDEAHAASPADAQAKLQQAKQPPAKELQDAQPHASPIPGGRTTDLGYCTVWVGTSTTPSTNLPSSSSSPNPFTASASGITLIYFPLLRNPRVPSLDPQTPAPPFLSTWNFVYTPDEVEHCVALARANYEEGKEQMRRAVRAVYERKKGTRLEREKRRDTEPEGERGVGDLFS